MQYRLTAYALKSNCKSAHLLVRFTRSSLWLLAAPDCSRCPVLVSQLDELREKVAALSAERDRLSAHVRTLTDGTEHARYDCCEHCALQVHEQTKRMSRSLLHSLHVYCRCGFWDVRHAGSQPRPV